MSRTIKHIIISSLLLQVFLIPRFIHDFHFITVQHHYHISEKLAIEKPHWKCPFQHIDIYQTLHLLDKIKIPKLSGNFSLRATYIKPIWPKTTEFGFSTRAPPVSMDANKIF